MVRLTDLTPAQAQRLAAFDCPNFATEPWVTGPPLSQRRVVIVSSPGLVVRGGVPFRGRDPDYHTILPGTRPEDLLISHVSINFDRTGFQEDWNVAFPINGSTNSPRKGRSARSPTPTIRLWGGGAGSDRTPCPRARRPS